MPGRTRVDGGSCTVRIDAKGVDINGSKPIGGARARRTKAVPSVRTKFGDEEGKWLRVAYDDGKGSKGVYIFPLAKGNFAELRWFDTKAKALKARARAARTKA